MKKIKVYLPIWDRRGDFPIILFARIDWAWGTLHDRHGRSPWTTWDLREQEKLQTLYLWQNTAPSYLFVTKPRRLQRIILCFVHFDKTLSSAKLMPTSLRSWRVFYVLWFWSPNRNRGSREHGFLIDPSGNGRLCFLKGCLRVFPRRSFKSLEKSIYWSSQVQKKCRNVVHEKDCASV